MILLTSVELFKNYEPKLLCLPVYTLPRNVYIFHSSISLTELLVNMCIEVAELRNIALPSRIHKLPASEDASSHQQK